LTITELPAASAGATFQANIKAGKFQGSTAPTTPMGSFTIRPRASPPVGAIRPKHLSTASAYQEKVSSVAGMSVCRHSVMGLPASTQSSAAISSACSRISATQSSNTRLRSAGAMPDHSPDSKLARAAATAASTSAAVPATRAPIVVLSIGLTTGMRAAEAWNPGITGPAYSTPARAWS